MKDNSKRRHLAKTITWRAVGTLDTMLLSWIISGNPLVGVQVGIIEVVTKMMLYYFHERMWFKLNLTRSGVVLESRKRHLAKAFTWRIIGTFDTILIAWVISGNPITGIKIGAAEVVTKTLLYYLHERTWYKINYGLNSRSSKRNE